jgi:PhnB protein
MILSPYLGFVGTCEEAFRFYANLLGGKITAMISFGETPAASAMPADRQKRHRPRPHGIRR